MKNNTLILAIRATTIAGAMLIALAASGCGQKGSLVLTQPAKPTASAPKAPN